MDNGSEPMRRDDSSDRAAALTSSLLSVIACLLRGIAL